MAAVTRFRPDHPLFRPKSFRTPVLLHFIGESARALIKWLFVFRSRDNPNRDAKDNATFFKTAAVSHKLGFWSGKPIYKRAKWITMVVRWLTAWFIVVNAVTLFHWSISLIHGVVTFIHANFSYMWDHRWYFPVFVLMLAGLICLYIVVSNLVTNRIQTLHQNHTYSTSSLSLIVGVHNWFSNKIRMR
jgi:hypothetical protein